MKTYNKNISAGSVAHFKTGRHGRQGRQTYSARSLHGQVVHDLGRRIVSGELPEGSVLPIETELGLELDVSRTALREGVKVLTAKGLLSSRTRTGTRVRPREDWNMLDPDVLAWRLETKHDEDFAQDLYDFRMAIEPMAASLAAVRITPEEIEEMQTELSGMVNAGQDIHTFVEHDLLFHRLILRSCRNELLASLSALIETALSFSFEIIEYKVESDLVEIHRNVFNAIKQGDAKAAHDEMINHLNRSREINQIVLAQLRAEKS